LETGSLTVELTPLYPLSNLVIGQLCNLNPSTPCGFQIAKLPDYSITKLFHFFVWRVLAATAAEFLEFQPVRRRLPIFRGRVIPLFALTTL
jgi:hypothetical protein